MISRRFGFCPCSSANVVLTFSVEIKGRFFHVLILHPRRFVHLILSAPCRNRCRSTCLLYSFHPSRSTASLFLAEISKDRALHVMAVSMFKWFTSISQYTIMASLFLFLSQCSYCLPCLGHVEYPEDRHYGSGWDTANLHIVWSGV